MQTKPPENEWAQNQPPAWQWILIVGVAIAVLCGLIVFAVLGYRTYNQWRADRSQKATEEEASEIAEATAAALERTMAIEKAQGWPLLIEENFDNNQNEWMVGEIEDEYSKIRLTLDGSYLWEVTAKQGFVWRVWPRSDIVSDFYLAAEVQNQSRNESAQYGLIFRNNENAYFYLEGRDSGYFRLMLYDGQSWQDLISSTYSELIRPGIANKFAVAAVDDVFYVLINDVFVGQARGNFPSEGQVGVAIGLSGEGEGAIIGFDNFEFRGLLEKE